MGDITARAISYRGSKKPLVIVEMCIRDSATRGEKEEIVYLDLSDLHPFKDHPFGVRDDAEMKSLVESVRNGGVNQPALVRPREGGGYEIIAGHRRQMASQLAGYRNMPCIVRNMTDDEALSLIHIWDACFLLP